MTNYLFIITYGRSGSTLLQGILNTIPTYKIVGENRNAYYHLYKFCDNMIAATHNSDHNEINNHLPKATNPWWNTHSVQDVKCFVPYVLQQFIDPKKEYSTIGFKEVRYYGIKELSNYLDWLYDTTHCTFIYLTRNMDDVVKSEWHRTRPDVIRIQYQTFEHNIKNHMEACDYQPWYHITYEQLKTREGIQGLFDFLKETPDWDKITETLATPHSYKTTGEVKITKLHVAK